MKLKQKVRRRWFRWLQSRRPRARTVHLEQKNTYIFPTRYGFLLAGTVLLMGIGATNYQNNLVFVATFTVMVLGVMGILLTYSNLVGLVFNVRQPEPVFAGQTARFPVSVSSHKAHLAVVIGDTADVAQSIDILPDTEQRVEVTQLCKKRGLAEINPLRCQTLYPLGFLQAWSWLFLEAKCIVYPKPLEPGEVHTSGEGSDTDVSGKFKPGNEEFYGLRAYQSGDLMSRIHWKSYAREKGIQTKQFVDYVSDPDLFSYDDFPGEEQELRLSYLCFLVVNAEQQKRYFGLSLPGVMIPADNGEEHLTKCLTALALYGVEG